MDNVIATKPAEMKPKYLLIREWIYNVMILHMHYTGTTLRQCLLQLAHILESCCNQCAYIECKSEMISLYKTNVFHCTH